MTFVLPSLPSKLALGTLAALTSSLINSSVYALTTVDLELWLGIDVSGSVDSSEFNLQKQGYANAFNSPAIQQLIANSTNGIAVGYGYWASSNQQNVAVDWKLLKTAQDASDFSTAITATTRPFGGATAVGAAIDFGTNQILTNAFDGIRKTIDISGDGVSNSGIAPSVARNAAEAKGITINGLAIGPSSIATYYADNVKTSNGFIVNAAGFSDFQTAVAQKLTREIGPGPGPDPTSTPEPVSTIVLGLFGLGIVALGKRDSSSHTAAI
jgi:hypothetical protein